MTKYIATAMSVSSSPSSGKLWSASSLARSHQRFVETPPLHTQATLASRASPTLVAICARGSPPCRSQRRAFGPPFCSAWSCSRWAAAAVPNIGHRMCNCWRQTSMSRWRNTHSSCHSSRWKIMRPEECRSRSTGKPMRSARPSNAPCSSTRRATAGIRLRSTWCSVTVHTYGASDFGGGRGQLCPRLSRQWARSVCDDALDATQRALPHNRFKLVDLARVQLDDPRGPANCLHGSVSTMRCPPFPDAASSSVPRWSMAATKTSFIPLSCGSMATWARCGWCGEMARAVNRPKRWRRVRATPSRCSSRPRSGTARTIRNSGQGMRALQRPGS